MIKENKQNKKTKKTVLILSTIIVILILVLAFFFIIQPQKIKYDEKKMLEGINYYVGSVILPQLQTNGYVQIPLGNETLVLVPYNAQE